ncbi:phenylalanine--tRNA ligase subunit alpha [Rickettsiales bacterium]|nr:phenylalanine--tRNA ligase subunit alpha [Rickettsiales bacterium]
MLQDLNNLKTDFFDQIDQIKTSQDLENIRISFLGKKGSFTALMQNMRNLSNEEKKSIGSQLNKTKVEISNIIQEKKEQFEVATLNKELENEKIDLTQPIRAENQGLIHPINKVMIEIEQIFSKMGFIMADGPEIEDDFHNFTALNIDKNHPARQMQDTFYLNNENSLLRTHTSSVQIRKMTKDKAPMKIITMGKVYRRDSDQTHTPMFHQIEGLLVGENINMGNLKWVLEKFLKEFFEIDDVAMRFRPSFFPFTEPSAELDIGYKTENNQIKIGGDNKFMEILGCGMVHPNVLKNVDIDPDKYQGFAFGIGIERLCMLKYGVTDLRMFFENDIRFLRHFGFNSKDF